MLDAVAQDVDHAALRDLALEPGEELAPRRAVGARARASRGDPPASPSRTAQLDEIDAVVAVVVRRGRRAANRCRRQREPMSRSRRAAARARRCSRSSRGRSDPRDRVLSCRWSCFDCLQVTSSLAASDDVFEVEVGEGLSARQLPASRAAASRTSSLPVTTSAIRRVRYSRRRSISTVARPRRCAQSLSVACRGYTNNRALFRLRRKRKSSRAGTARW